MIQQVAGKESYRAASKGNRFSRKGGSEYMVPRSDDPIIVAIKGPLSKG